MLDDATLELSSEPSARQISERRRAKSGAAHRFQSKIGWNLLSLYDKDLQDGTSRTSTLSVKYSPNSIVDRFRQRCRSNHQMSPALGKARARLA